MMFYNQIRRGLALENVVHIGFCALFLFFLNATISTAAAHELEDGCIEKTISIVVRDYDATIEMSLGINEATMKQQLEKWLAESETAAELQGPDVAENVTDDFEKKFRECAFEQFAKEIKVSLDGHPTSLTKVSVEPSPRHHFTLIAKYSFVIPKQQRVKLLIEDQSLKEMKGGSRYSLKAMGKSILFKSNVAPIIVRADRNDLSKLSAQQLAKVSRIEALVGGTFKAAKEAAEGTDNNKN